MFRSGQTVQNSVLRDPARHESPWLTELLACRGPSAHHSPSWRGPPRLPTELSQSSRQAPVEVQPHPLHPHHPRNTCPGALSSLEAPSSAPACLSGTLLSSSLGRRGALGCRLSPEESAGLEGLPLICPARFYKDQSS